MTDSHSDRHAAFDRLRAETPIYYDEASASFLLTRMADARRWLSDRSQWKDADRAEPGALVRSFKPADMNRPGDRNSGIGWMDDPDHARVRAPIQHALIRRVATIGPVVEAIVRSQLATLTADQFDALADYASPIPVAVIGYLLGVDTTDFDQFRAWSEASLAIFDRAASEESRRATKAASEAMTDYLDEAMTERRRAPRDDLISDLLAVQAADGALSDSEIRVNCFNLLAGGNVTTADLIANGIDLFLRHPQQLAALRADPALIGPAVEEILRFAPPTGGTQRVASRDLEIRDCPVRTGQVAAVMIAAANRDPAAFPDPHRFDIARRDGPHIAFGGGPHICIGAPLARLEARIAIARLFDRFPTLRLADPDAPPLWRPNPYFHGLEAVKVRS